MRVFLCVALALVFSSFRASADDACPAAQVRKVDLDAWAKAARKAKTAAELDGALAKLGLPKVSGGSDKLPCAHPAVKRLHVDVFEPKLRDDGAVKVVQVLAVMCGDDPDAGWQLQRGVVLVPQAPGDFCAVETPFLNQVGAGPDGELCNPTVFAFESLTSATHAVMKVTEEDEWCGGGADRGRDVTVSWWELQGLALAKILSGTTFSAHYHSPVPPIATHEMTFKPQGKAFPKPVQVVRKDSCDKSLEDEFPPEDPLRKQIRECRETTQKLLCTYENGAYACH